MKKMKPAIRMVRTTGVLRMAEMELLNDSVIQMVSSVFI